MCKGFIEMWRHVWLRARVLKEMLSFCHYVQGFYGNGVARKAMCKGFKERLFVAFARLAAMCKGFKGNALLSSLRARVFMEIWRRVWQCAKFLKKQCRCCSYVKGF